jgi:lipoyl(octanoyl) transferase
MLAPAAPRTCNVRDLGAMRWGGAYELQTELVGQRQRGEIGDQLLLVEHPHVVTMGRNGQAAHLLASAEVLAATGIEYYETNRGGDVTYHGPGQLVGYPIVQLNEWKRDVHAYVRALEEVVIRVLADFGLTGERVAGATGVWTGGAKICAIGVHLSRWVSSHGFALNVTTDLQYFQYIVPCGLTKPVTSLRQLGVAVSMDEVKSAVRRRFAEVYEYQ